MKKLFNEKTFLILLTIILAVIFIDQLTKIIFEINYQFNEVNVLIPNLLYLTKTYNTGAAWSMFSDSTLFLALTSLTVSILVMYFIILSYNEENKYKLFLYQTGLALIFAGGVGNMIDRFLCVFEYREGVVDFIGMYIFDYAFPVYNVADMSVVFGVSLIVIYLIFYLKDSKLNHQNEEEIEDIINDDENNIMEDK